MFAGPIESKQKGGARRAEFLRSPHSCASLTQDAEGWGVRHGVRGLGESAHGGAGAREGRARGVLGTLARSSFFFPRLLRVGGLALLALIRAFSPPSAFPPLLQKGRPHPFSGHDARPKAFFLNPPASVLARSRDSSRWRCVCKGWERAAREGRAAGAWRFGLFFLAAGAPPRGAGGPLGQRPRSMGILSVIHPSGGCAWACAPHAGRPWRRRRGGGAQGEKTERTAAGGGTPSEGGPTGGAQPTRSPHQPPTIVMRGHLPTRWVGGRGK